MRSSPSIVPADRLDRDIYLVRERDGTDCRIQISRSVRPPRARHRPCG